MSRFSLVTRRALHHTKRFSHSLPVVKLEGATIYQQHPTSESSKPLLRDIEFSIDSSASSKTRWAIVSRDASAIRTKFLHVLQGQYICLPPTARSWPFINSAEYKDSHEGLAGEPSRALRYVGFANAGAGLGSSGTQGAYLSARYESRRETTDWTLHDYLRGTVSLNLSTNELDKAEELQESSLWSDVVTNLDLKELLGLPVGNLSNGQTRRARIAKALLQGPEVLLLDEPFAGLDPVNYKNLSSLLSDLADRSSPRIVLSLQATEPIPDWITHVLELDKSGEVVESGPKRVPSKPRRGQPDSATENSSRSREVSEIVKWDHYSDKQDGSSESSQLEPLLQMEGVKVTYGDHCVLGNWHQEVAGEKREGLHWTIRPGERWGIFGANGSGKTTIISLLTSDHPQAYSLPMKIFGRSRLPSVSEPGISIFDIQSRIGHSSPEVHTYFPKSFSIRRVLESAWAEAFHSRPLLTFEADQRIAAALRWFRHELDPVASKNPDIVEELFSNKKIHEKYVTAWIKGSSRGAKPLREWLKNEDDPIWADEATFAQSSLSAQKVALFLRAVIKKPDIIVLDEAFSGMDEQTRTKCMLWLAHGEEQWIRYPDQSRKMQFKGDTALKTLNLVKNTGLEPRQAVVCVSHRQEEVPFVINRWMHLPEPNEGKTVRFGEVDRDSEGDYWQKIWQS